MDINEEIARLDDEIVGETLSNWLASIIDYFEANPEGTDLPPDLVDSWDKLNDWERLRMFILSIGAIRGLMDPPEFVGALV